MARLFTRGSWPEAKRVASVLRQETAGGMLLLIAAAAALIWANSPWSGLYDDISEFRIGPAALSVEQQVERYRFGFERGLHGLNLTFGGDTAIEVRLAQVIVAFQVT